MGTLLFVRKSSEEEALWSCFNQPPKIFKKFLFSRDIELHSLYIQVVQSALWILNMANQISAGRCRKTKGPEGCMTRFYQTERCCMVLPRTEAFVWFIAAFPAILALAGASRLCQVMCKMQLACACLGQGCVLTEPMDSSTWDVTLLIALRLGSLQDDPKSVMMKSKLWLKRTVEVAPCWVLLDSI